MEEAGFFKDRKVVPRWRAIDRAHPSELISAQNITPQCNTDEALKFYYKKWQKDQSVENASEVIDVAITAKEKALAVGPAEQILKSKDVLPAVQAVARYIKEGGGRKIQDNFEKGFSNRDDVRHQVSTKIKGLKGRVKNEPRNAFLWLEIARLNSWVGHVDNAELSIKRAFGAAPENRFVLRAMATFFTHINKVEEAYFRIIRAESLKTDPWVQAAEIALSRLVLEIPKSIIFARQNLRRRHLPPVHTSELASALATEELILGKKKNARDLFKASLLEPTDNSVAQALWAKDRVSVNVGDRQLLIERAFEARTKASLSEGLYEDALKHCAFWGQDEPFSVYPAIEGSHIALAFLDDFDKAVQFVDQGLFSNPNSFSLWNNGAVAYARAGKLNEARRYFEHIDHAIKSNDPEPTALATRGLIDFRAGDWQQGRLYYEKSLMRAIKQKSIDVAFRAKYHWLYEEVFAGLMEEESIKKVIKMLNRDVKKLGSHVTPTSKELWEKMKKQIEDMILDYDYKGSSLFSPKMMLEIDQSK